MNEFIFHNVGQGLFYSGHLQDRSYNFIYDCGSVSDRKFLYNAIDNQLGSEDIDFIVISHLDVDHFNGLSKVLSNHVVKKIYLPYLGYGVSNVIKLKIAYAFIQDQDNIDDYMFFINMYDEDQRRNYNFDIEYLGSNAEPNNDNADYWYSTKKLLYYSGKADFWEFIMFNKRVSNKKLTQLDKDINTQLVLYGVKDVTELMNKGMFSIIEAIYKKIFKNLNLTSTVMIHRPLYETYIYYSQFLLHYPHYLNTSYFSKPVTILAGDAEFDKQMLINLDNELIKELNIFTVFQVPHHGSKANWNSLTFRYKFVFHHYIIPFGLGRKHHPNITVIKELSLLKTNSVSMNTEIGYVDYFIK